MSNAKSGSLLKTWKASASSVWQCIFESVLSCRHIPTMLPKSWDEAKSGIIFPACHCAFKSCSWTSTKLPCEERPLSHDGYCACEGAWLRFGKRSGVVQGLVCVCCAQIRRSSNPTNVGIARVTSGEYFTNLSPVTFQANLGFEEYMKDYGSTDAMQDHPQLQNYSWTWRHKLSCRSSEGE